MNKSKQYSLMVLLTCFLGVVIMVTLTIFIDPCFHYHSPNQSFSYSLNNERYQNDGIMRQWNYNAMIVGTSMTENFKTSELDKLFSKNSIKVPFSGASYKEISDNINRAVKYNSDLDMIVRGIDYSMFYTSADYMRYDKSTYPEYLTNDNVWDDIYYLLNKEIFLKDVCTTLLTLLDNEKTITNFDEAYNWQEAYTFDKDVVLKSYDRVDSIDCKVEASEEEILTFKENIEKNLVKIVKENPQIEFYYFLTPYSVCYWDDLNQKGGIEKHLLGERMIIEALMTYDNVQLYSFSNNFELTTNLNNYKDIAHYSEDINSYILKCMRNEEYRITEENYEIYLENIKNFYITYDYENLFVKNNYIE